MERNVAVPVDLKARRKSRRHTQTKLGNLLGVSLQQVSNYETGRCSLPLDQACKVAILYDGLTLEYDGVKLELKPVFDAGTKHSGDLNPLTGALIAGKEMRDFLEHTKKLAEYALAVTNGECGTQYMAGAVKEAQEAKEAAERFLLVVRKANPEAYRRGMEMAKVACVAKVQAS